MNRAPRRQTASSEKLLTEESVIILPAAKIHRANIISRILNALSIVRQQWAFHALHVFTCRRRNADKKMLTALNGVFRKNQHEGKFQAIQKLKKKLLTAGQQQISKTQKVIAGMENSSKKILFMVLRALRRERISGVFSIIKRQSQIIYFEKRNEKRKALRIIVQTLLKNKRWAYEKLATSRVITFRKQTAKKLAAFLHHKRKNVLGQVMWNLRKNLMLRRKDQVLEDIQVFQEKLNNQDDPEMKALQEKKEKLEDHLRKIQEERNELEAAHNAEVKEIEKEKQQIQEKKSSLINENKELQGKIKQLQEEVKTPFTMDQIYQCLYNNFLLYVSENKEQVYNKEEVLASLTQPLLPIDVPIQIIKQENKVMQELISEYVLMFGQKKLEEPIELPYEYLVKQNHALYKMLLTLLPQTDSDREDLRLLKDGIFKLNARVSEVWGSS